MSDKTIKNFLNPTIREVLDNLINDIDTKIKIEKYNRDREAEDDLDITPDIEALEDALNYTRYFGFDDTGIEQALYHAQNELKRKNERWDKLVNLYTVLPEIIEDLEQFIDLDAPIEIKKAKETIKILNPELIDKVYQKPPQVKYPVKLKTPEGDEFVILGYTEVDKYLGLTKNSTHSRFKSCKTRHSDGSIPYMGYTMRVLSIEEFERLTGVNNGSK